MSGHMGMPVQHSLGSEALYDSCMWAEFKRMSKPTREFSLGTTFPSLIKIDIVYEGTSRKQNSYLIHLRLVSDRSVEMVAVSSNLLSRHWAPCSLKPEKKKGLQDEGYIPMRETINRWTKKNKQCNKKDNNVCRLLNYSTRNWTQVDILLEQGTGQRTDQWLTEDYPCKPDWRLSSKHFIFREKKLPFIPKLQSSIVSRSSGPLAIVTLGKNQTTVVKP